ncbi:MAG: hypothetical protein JZU52_12600 [Lamprocystis purpurea]|jgi:prophage antirepressor-like protein|uniref:BRO-N domain-containing protein n=1 Tax=Lamprocystis purpurea TaxID=61598 RepID=UPI0003A1AA0B|nr:BRO family protein [Lamprocystis purpurea]MBV5274435.1 hypothetical protein [Lamprocystis purpurea]
MSQSASSVVLFEFHTHQLRVIPTEDGGSFWVVAKDVADILGLTTAKDVCRIVPEHHKGRHSVPTLGGSQEMLCLDEAGLYRAVLRSDKLEAEPFMEWVTAEVLPQIRRTGSYQGQTSKADLEAIADRANTLIAQAERREAAAKRAKREAKTAWLHAVERDQELSNARAESARLAACLSAAQALALDGHAHLSSVLHFARKDLDANQIHRLTDLPEPLVADLLARAEAAGFCPSLSQEHHDMVTLVRNGLVTLDPFAH